MSSHNFSGENEPDYANAFNDYYSRTVEHRFIIVRDRATTRDKIIICADGLELRTNGRRSRNCARELTNIWTQIKGSVLAVSPFIHAKLPGIGEHAGLIPGNLLRESGISLAGNKLRQKGFIISVGPLEGGEA